MTPEQVIQKAINDDGNIGLSDFRFLYGTRYMDARVGQVTLGEILQGARMVMIDVRIPVEILIEIAR